MRAGRSSATGGVESESAVLLADACMECALKVNDLECSTVDEENAKMRGW